MRHPIPTRRKRLFALGACLALAGSAAVISLADDAAVERSVRKIARALGMTDAQIEAVKRGELVSSDLQKVSDKELGLTFMARSDAGIDWLYQRLESGAGLDSDPAIRSHGALGSDPRAGLASLELPDDELDRLLAATPGDTVNLSSAEFGELQSVAEETEGQPADQRRQAVLEAFRDLLAVRVEAYRERGLAGIAPYDRGEGESASPAQELGAALESLADVGAMSSEIYEALRKHPAASGLPLESRDYWIVQEAHDRTAVALVHRAFGRRNDRLMSVEWRYYVSNTFNSMLVAIGVFPLDAGGSVFVYANRTFTDQVAGFMGGAARSIGRKIMRGEIEDLYAAFKKDVKQGGDAATR